jgi:PAS domain S-box-containing protein
MTGFEMAPSARSEEILALCKRIAELEALVERHQRGSAGEERFRQLADAAPLMIWTADADALCIFFNRAWLEFRGRTLEEERGNGWTAGIHPEDRELYLQTFLNAFGVRQPFRVQYRLCRADGNYALVEGRGFPHHDGAGNFAGLTGSAVDVSDRQHVSPDEHSAHLVYSLTERERQVLVLIADGKSTKEAAAQLGISYKTADSHRSRILEKLGVHETASMVRHAIRAGLIEP